MATYIKLQGLEEYCVSDDGQYIMKRHNSDSDWTPTYVIPKDKKVMDFRETRTGAQVQVMFSDGHWYEDNGHGFLHLTHEEREKERTVKQDQQNIKKITSRGDKTDTTRKSKQSSSAQESLSRTISKTKTSFNNFRKINDSSEFEYDTNHIVNDYLSGQQNWIENVYREAEENDKRIQREAKRREKELEKLKKIEQIIDAKETKRKIFSNLDILFKNVEIDYIYTEMIAAYTGVSDPELISVISLALDGCKKSLENINIKPSDKFYLYWSEVFYLIQEGLVFNEKHINHIIKLINKEFGGHNISGLDDDDCIEGFIKWIYSNKAPYAFEGYNFEKLPNDDKIRERIDCLERNLFNIFDEDIEDNLNSSDNTDWNKIINSYTQLLNTNNHNFKISNNKKTPPSKRTVSTKNIFPELMETFKKEAIIDESIKPKSLFDFSTRNRNRKVEILKEKRSISQEKIDKIKKDLRKCLISILKSTEKLFNKEKSLSETKDTPIKTSREKENLEKKIERIEDQIEDIQEDIRNYNVEVKEYMDDLLSNIEMYNKINQELFDFTSSSMYATKYCIQGSAITIAKSISRNVETRDSNSLMNLFKEYLEK